MYRITPFTGRIAERWQSRLGRPTGARAACVRRFTVSPAVERIAPPAIYEEGDLARITAVAPDGNTIELQLAKLRGGLGRHMATEAFVVRDVVLWKGHLFNHQFVGRFGNRTVPLLTGTCTRRTAPAVLASSPYGLKYFGHWMSDDLPLGLAARSIGEPVSLLSEPTPQQADYLTTLDLDCTVEQAIRFDELTILEDFAQNDFKRARYAILRARAAAGRTVDRHPGVLLLRGTSGERRMLSNESEVVELARRRGLQVLDPAALPAKDVVRVCLGARMVLGVEGSQLMNGLMWMDPDGVLVVIQPPMRFNAVLKDRCDAESMRFAFVVGDREDDGAFCINLSRLERMLDRVAR